jgi:magnesium-transporting ATPase (P-type)
VRIHQVSADAAEARRRLAEFGPNDVERLERPSPVLALLRELFALIVWVAAGMAPAAALAEPGTGMATLGAAIVAVIAVNAVFSFWQQHRAERAPQALEQLLPARALSADAWLMSSTPSPAEAVAAASTSAARIGIVYRRAFNRASDSS